MHKQAQQNFRNFFFIFPRPTITINEVDVKGSSASGATSTRELLNKKMDMNSEDIELYNAEDFSEALSDSEPT